MATNTPNINTPNVPDAPVASQKSLITVNRIATKPVVEQLTRIADALEIICQQAFGYNVRPPKADTSGPEPTVDYTDDTSILVREILDLKKSPEPIDTPIGEAHPDEQIGEQ